MKLKQNKTYVHLGKVLDTPFRVYYFDEESGMLASEWKPSSMELEENSFLQESEMLADLIGKYDPQRILLDQCRFNYVIPMELMEGYVMQYAELWTMGSLKKIALVVEHNLLVNISLETLIQESQKLGYRPINNRFFNNSDEAMKWLMTQD